MMNIILDGGMTAIHDKSRNRGVDAMWRVTGLLCEYACMGRVQAGSKAGEINWLNRNTTGHHLKKALEVQADFFVKLPVVLCSWAPPPAPQCSVLLHKTRRTDWINSKLLYDWQEDHSSTWRTWDDWIRRQLSQRNPIFLDNFWWLEWKYPRNWCMR